MGDYYDNKPTSTALLFYQRGAYDRVVFEEIEGLREPDSDPRDARSNLVNYRLSEFTMFGKVNQFFVPVVVRPENLRRFKAPQIDQTQTTPEALDFVVNIFEQMAESFKKNAAFGQIDPKDPYLSNLKVYKAYQNPTVLYEQYFTLLSYTLKNQFLERRIQVRNFPQFMDSLLGILEQGAQSMPFTQIAYVKSKQCPSRCSGLVIEIADLDYNNDQDKIDKFYNSLNWGFYLQACDNFGFAVDSTAPWRLMADLDSVIMKEAASQYGGGGSRAVMARAFKDVAPSYILRRFSRDLYNLYNFIRNPIESTFEICNNNQIVPTTFHSEEYTYKQFQRKFSMDYILEKYFQIRFMEEESNFSHAEQRRLIRQCLSIIHAGRAGMAIVGFEKILNKPFDYMGSISYNLNSAEQREQEADDNAIDPDELSRELERLKARIKK